MKVLQPVSIHAFCAFVLFLICCCPLFAQTNNSWVGATSGNWEDVTNWSLGILPGTNQSIFLTNAGWKAVAIGPNTTQNFPQTFNVASLTITSPTNTENTLLMNYAGLQTPLQVHELYIESNSVLYMLSSALEVSGDFHIGGTLVATEGSSVSGPWTIDIGDIGPATCNITNSAISTMGEYMGGGYTATFNQQGGTNSTSFIVLTNFSTYNLYDGCLTNFGGPLALELQGGSFKQWNGNVTATLAFQDTASYYLAGGTLSPGDLNIPGGPSSWAFKDYDGIFTQSGGTNLAGAVSLGGLNGRGSYGLSGGVLTASSISVGCYANENSTSVSACGFGQSGGYNTNGGLSIGGGFDRNYDMARAGYYLSGGILQTPSITMSTAVFSQTGGTNQTGSIAFQDEFSIYQLQDGCLNAGQIHVLGGQFWTPSDIGYFEQSGGTNAVGMLWVDYFGTYKMEGGQLNAQNILVTGGTFQHSGGSVSISSTLTLSNATWQEMSSGANLGPLQLMANGTNSFSTIPSVLQFANSSSLAWSSNATLTIQNWKGSLVGGGRQQILFGNNASALTPQQLNLIEFLNPAGLASGFYPARILANGELVPNAFRPVLGLSMSGGSAQLNLLAEANETYEIDVSSNLVNWTKLTSQMSSSNGTLSVTDTFSRNYPARFYRAVIAP